MLILRNKPAIKTCGFLLLLFCVFTSAGAQQRHVHYVDPLFGTVIDYDIYRYPSLVTVENGKYEMKATGVEQIALNAITYIQSNRLDEWRKLNIEKVSPEQLGLLQKMTGPVCQMYYHISFEGYEVFIFYPSTFPMRLLLPFKLHKGMYKIDKSFMNTTFNKLLAHNNFDPFTGEKVYNMKCLSGFESVQGNKMADYSGYQSDIRASKYKFSGGSDYGQGVLVDASAVSLVPAEDDPLFQNTFQVNCRMFLNASSKTDTTLLLSTIDKGAPGFLGIYSVVNAGNIPQLYIMLRDKKAKKYGTLVPVPVGKWFSFSLSYAFNTAKVYIDKEQKASFTAGARFDYEHASFIVGKNTHLPYEAANASIDELVIGFE